MHIKEEVLDADGKIDPFKLDAVARLGADWYCRVQGDAIFSVPKPLNTQGIGVDNIPPEIRFSKILTGNDLGLLGNIERLPDVAKDREFIAMYPVQQALQAGADSVHTMARVFLSEGKIEDAWKILLLSLQK
jgi:hypothetical protein